MNRGGDKFPKVTVIVLNYNGRKFLSWSLPSILKTDYPNLEFLLVDNNSNDDSVRFVRERFPSIKIIENDKNLGFAEGCNVGIKNATGKYVALLNNDVMVDPLWLQNLVRFSESHPKVAACAPKILALVKNKNRENVFLPTNIIYNLSSAQDVLGFAFSEGEGQVDEGQSKEKEIFSTCGICLLRKDAVEKVGGFDRDYFFSHEDIDLCWRLRLLGYQIYSVPSSIIYHRWREKKMMVSIEGWYLEERNRLSTMLKNYSSGSLFKYLPVYLFVQLGKLMIFSFLRSRLIISVLKAITWNLLQFRHVYRKRLLTQKIRRTTDKEVTRFMHKGSVEFARFLQGRARIFVTGFGE